MANFLVEKIFLAELTTLSISFNWYCREKILDLRLGLSSPTFSKSTFGDGPVICCQKSKNYVRILEMKNYTRLIHLTYNYLIVEIFVECQKFCVSNKNMVGLIHVIFILAWILRTRIHERFRHVSVIEVGQISRNMRRRSKIFFNVCRLENKKISTEHSL